MNVRSLHLPPKLLLSRYRGGGEGGGRAKKKKKNLTQLGTKPRSRAVSRIRLRRKSSQIRLEMIQRCQEVSGGQLHNGMRLFIYLFTLGQTDLLTVHYTSCRAETLCLAEAANTDSPLIR